MTVGDTSVTVRQAAGVTCADPPNVILPVSVLLGGAVGRSASVYLLEDERCRYEVTENIDWVAANSTEVAGNETVTFTTTDVNDTGADRTETAAIGALSVNVTQAWCPGAPTRIRSVSPTMFAPDTGRSFQIALPYVTPCVWPVSADQEWISTSQATISGLQTVRTTVAPNKGAYRTGVLSIGTWTLPVHQWALTKLTSNRDTLIGKLGFANGLRRGRM